MDINGKLLWYRIQIQGGLMNIEDYKLELKFLQMKDTEEAQNNGFNEGPEWASYISNQEDKIPKAIISLASRYNLDPIRVAKDFDQKNNTMILRLKKALDKESAKKQLKQK